MNRLEEIEAIINYLKKQLREAQKEQEKLLKEKFRESRKMFDSLPTRAKTALDRAGIKDDCSLMHFLNGDFPEEKMQRVYDYKNAKTKKQRLMCVRDIGNNCADEILAIVEVSG